MKCMLCDKKAEYREKRPVRTIRGKVFISYCRHHAAMCKGFGFGDELVHV